MLIPNIEVIGFLAVAPNSRNFLLIGLTLKSAVHQRLVGIGIIFGNYLSGAMRNPSAAQKQFPNLLLGFALAEATGLFGLVVALIILFAF